MSELIFNADEIYKSGKISRRKFLALIGAGAVIAANPSFGAFEISPAELARWRSSLIGGVPTRRYQSDRHKDARMHLGGIGTGNFEIGADGQCTTWQLFNTLRDGAVPFYFFVKVGSEARLLQTDGGPNFPRIQKIEMTGEYPFAKLYFQDKDLPLKIELDAFSPFVPLDAVISSMPLAIFKFRISNLSKECQTVSLSAMLTNPIGYAAIGDFKDCAHPGVGFNLNQPYSGINASGFILSACRGADATLDKPVAIYLLDDVFLKPPDPFVGYANYACSYPEEIALPPLDRPKNLKVFTIDPQHFFPDELSSPESSLIWLEDAPVNLTSELLSKLKQAVQRGMTLVFSGKQMPLLRAYATFTQGHDSSELLERPDIVFEDFENDYANWTVSGIAFGQKPAHVGFSNQQSVSGFLGSGFVNSYFDGDGATGKLTSKDFVIKRYFLRFLIGGGSSDKTQIRLLINGRVERASSGKNSETLMPDIWNVAEFMGQSAQIQIADESITGWGHITVDQIVFTDWPGEGKVPDLLKSVLPLRFSGIKEAKSGFLFENGVLAPESERLNPIFQLDQYIRKLGKGKVYLIGGQILNSSENYATQERQKAFSILCSLIGAEYIKTSGQSSREPGFGTMAIMAIGERISGTSSFENWDETLSDFQKERKFSGFKSLSANVPTPAGRTTNCAVASTVEIPPGETVTLPFLLTWHYPNKYGEAGDWVGCNYTTQWNDAAAVMNDAVGRFTELCEQTERFHKFFYNSTLPYWLLDCITANLATIRHVGVVFQIANGDTFGWEGSNGSCQPTCTHVWGYAQSLAYLFPELERKMRCIDFEHQQNSDGGINNRTDVPSPPYPTNEHPFTDGHISSILKAYREGLNSPDDTFFKKYWPKAKLALEYLISRDSLKSGGKPRGVLEDEQWNTYDEALNGVSSFISGYYLAALRAGEEWARRIGDTPAADRFHEIFKAGQFKILELCWNGEYFEQYLPDYLNRKGEVGPGCMADQLIGQWWAHQLGLGYILPREKVVLALHSIFKYNWKSDLTGWKHQPRAYTGAGEKGLINCTWPRGGRPNNALQYSDEIWSGIEYEVASLMIYEGLLEEGFSITKGARDRYDGIPRPPIKRNPWCEIECGGHYARAMSSWALLTALSGYRYDGPAGKLFFGPRRSPGNFECFFSAVEGWGSLKQEFSNNSKVIEISVAAGKLWIKGLELDCDGGGNFNQLSAKVANSELQFNSYIKDGKCSITFAGTGATLLEGEKLLISC